MNSYKIKIVFSTPIKWKPFSWLIKKRLKTNYSHVSIWVYLDCLNFWDIYEASHGDVHIIGRKKFLKTNKIIEHYNLDLNREQFLSGLKFLKPQLQKSYSEIGAISSTFKVLRNMGLGKDGDKQFICSELAARYIEEVFNISYNKYRIETDYIDPYLFRKIIQENLL